MYNFTDTNPTLFNLKAEPFFGRLVFVLPGTTKNYVNVQDVDGNNLGHEVMTNMYGRLQTQVILDRTVDCQYWEFTGNIWDVEDSAQFTLIRTERIYDPAEVIGIKVDGAQTVQTVSELRQIDPTAYEPYTTVLRMGYYRGGDHSPLAYCWDPTMGGNDDGGYVIKPVNVTGMGRWVAMFPDNIDVRWFGVKPADLESQVTYQSSAIMAAVDRAMLMGKTLYFPSSGANTYYGLDNINLNVGTADIRLDSGVKLVGKSGTRNSISCHNLYCDRNRKVFIQYDQDQFSVKAHEVWTASLASYGQVTAEIVHWNAAMRKTSWSNCSIEFEAEPAHTMTFDNCELSFEQDAYRFQVDDSLGFYNMQFTDRYFQDGRIEYGYVNVDASCRAIIGDFRDAVNWFNLMRDHQVETLSCSGVFMSEATVDWSVILSDVNFGSLTVQAGNRLEIHGGTVRVLAMDDAGQGVLLDGVTLGHYSGASSVNCSALVLRDSTVSNTSLSAATATVTRSTVAGPVVCTAFTANASEFTSPVNCSIFNAMHCTFTAGVGVHFIGTLSVTCLNNTFANAPMTIGRRLDSTSENVLARNCSWVGNRASMAGDWLTLDRTYLDPDDSKHSYEYRDNGDGDTVFKQVTLYHGGSENPSTPALRIVSKSDDTAHGTVIFHQCSSDSAPELFSGFRLFTIGTVNVRARLTLEIYGRSLDRDNAVFGATLPGFSPTVKLLSDSDRLVGESGAVPAGLVWKGGNTWAWHIPANAEAYTYVHDPNDFTKFSRLLWIGSNVEWLWDTILVALAGGSSTVTIGYRAEKV